MSEMQLKFGLFAKPLAAQLEDQGFRFKSERDEDRFEKLVHAWNMLRVHGIQTDGEARKSGKRLVKSIMERIEPMENET